VDYANRGVKIEIGRHAPKGTVISRYRAYDADSGANGKINYALIGSNLPFDIDEEGVVTATRDISVAVGHKYDFKVEATDDGKPAMSSQLSMQVVEKEGTKPPTFTQALYRRTFTAEEAQIGAPVVTVSTTDQSTTSTAQFRVSAGDSDNTYCIDSTKELYIQRPPDTHKKVNLKVEMVNGFQQAVTNVVITYKQENDHSPVFTKPGPVVVTLPENYAVGKILYKAVATDPDVGDDGKIQYSIVQVSDVRHSAGHFEIVPNTGEVKLVQQLNYEVKKAHRITIQAQNGGDDKRKALQQLVVMVTDINDEVPTFVDAVYYGYVPSTAKVGYQRITTLA
jgi:hypothetical protein